MSSEKRYGPCTHLVRPGFSGPYGLGASHFLYWLTVHVPVYIVPMYVAYVSIWLAIYIVCMYKHSILWYKTTGIG